MRPGVAEQQSPTRCPEWSVIVYFIGLHLAALTILLPGTFSWPAVGVMLFLHWLTGAVGITLGYHRLLAHRSFRASKWLEYAVAFCGTLAGQPVLYWVGYHRMHHRHSDTEADPHDSRKGFWWAHVGWMLVKPAGESPPYQRYVKDIARDPVYRLLDRTCLLWQAPLGLALFAVGGWPFVIWGIFVRLVVVYHCTWLVNSAAHQFGYRANPTSDRSTNAWWVTLLTYGEGWHNNHHACPRSARHGLQRWELDPTWWMIKGLQAVGLVHDVRLALPNQYDSVAGHQRTNPNM